MKKNFMYYLLPSIVISVLGTLIVVPVSTYFLDPKDFGIFAIVNAITMPIGPLSSTGVAWVLSANYFKISEQERKNLVFNILLSDLALKVFWVGIFWAFSGKLLPLIIKEYNPQYNFYFELTLVSVLLSTFWPSISCLIVLQEKGGLHAVFQILQWLGGVIAILVCFLVFKLGTVTLFLGPVISSAVSLVAGLWYVRNHIIFKMSKQWLREILKLGLPSIPMNLSEMVTNISDRYFIQRWLDLGQLGIYSHSQSYKNVFVMATKAFTRTFGPAALEAYSLNLDQKKIEGFLKSWYGILGVGGVFLTLFSPEIVNILTHGKFLAAAYLIPIWFFFMMFSTYGFPYIQFLVVHKKSSFVMWSQIITGGIFIIVTALATQWFGIIGTALAIVLSNFGMQIVQLVRAKKMGCVAIGEKEFSWMMILLISVYLMTGLVHINVFEKSIIFLVLAGFLTYQFRFHKILGDMLKGKRPFKEAMVKA